jgi:hypothetical protein
MENDSALKLPKKWREFKSKDLQAAHDEILRLRGTLYGHSSADANVMLIIPEGCYSREIKQTVPKTSWLFHTYVPAHEALLGFRSVAAELQARLQAEVSRLLEHLYDGMDLPKRAFRLNIESEGL